MKLRSNVSVRIFCLRKKAPMNRIRWFVRSLALSLMFVEVGGVSLAREKPDKPQDGPRTAMIDELWRQMGQVQRQIVGLEIRDTKPACDSTVGPIAGQHRPVVAQQCAAEGVRTRFFRPEVWTGAKDGARTRTTAEVTRQHKRGPDRSTVAADQRVAKDDSQTRNCRHKSSPACQRSTGCQWQRPGR
jgi:hypothetical protein